MNASQPVDPASVVGHVATFNDPDTRDFGKQSLELCRDFKLDVELFDFVSPLGDRLSRAHLSKWIGDAVPSILGTAAVVSALG